MSAPAAGEIWREVPTHAGYWASSAGRLRGPWGRILRPLNQPCHADVLLRIANGGAL